MIADRKLMALLIWLGAACGSPATAPPVQAAHRIARPTNEAERAVPKSADPPALPSGRPALSTPGTDPAVLPKCVMHAGVTEVETTERGGPGGKKIGSTEHKSSCYYNAECVREHGVLTAGDGIVRIHCEGRACVCRIEFMPPRESVHEFSFEAACETNEQAEQLLRDRCIPTRMLPEDSSVTKP